MKTKIAKGTKMDPKNRYLIKWHSTGWRYSTNAGKAWQALNADNENDSSEAIREAAELLGIPTSQWDLVENGD